MRVAIYSRKSVETDKGDSIKNQIKMCKEYFNLRNDSVSFEVFEDEGFTGANINRPSFKLMMKQLNDFDVVAVYRIDRISRNVLDFLNTFEEFKKHNIKFISITENFDTESPMGKMMLLMLSGFAQMERENIAQRVKDNMRELAKSGKWTGGTIPFGYITQRVEENNKKATYLKLDESKLQLIKEIFNQYIKSESMHNVQKWLYNSGIKWCLSTIKNILTSPVYVKANKDVIEYLKNFGEMFGTYDNFHGILSYNRRPYSNGKHRWNDKSMFYAISKHEGIIEADMWLKIQSIQDKTKKNPRPKESHVSYLTGTLKCAKCGSPITVSHNHKNKDGSITYVYVCTGRKTYGVDYCDTKQIKQSILDDKFIKSLKNYANMDFDTFKTLFNKINKVTDKSKDIKTLEKKISSNDIKIDNLIEQSEELSVNAAKRYLIRIEELTSQNEELRQKFFLLKQKELDNSSIPIEFIYNTLNQFVSNFEKLDISEKREAINKFIEKVEYNSDSMNLHVTFL